MIEEQKREITKVGIIMPISGSDGYTEKHWQDVLQIIKETLSSDIYKIDLVSKSNEVSVIQDSIVNNLYNDDIVICDVSSRNPNAMFELGMRLAFDKPTVVIKDDDTKYSFDTSPLRHIEYPRSLHYQSINEFKKDLLKQVEDTLEAVKSESHRTFLSNFGQIKVAHIENKVVSESEFIIDSLKKINKKISNMERSKSIEHLSSPVSMQAITTEIYKAFKSYRSLFDVEFYGNEDYVKENYIGIRDHAFDHVKNKFMLADSVIGQVFDNKFDSLLESELDIPF